ncbi:MAG TPA: alpha/beta hydrolase [Actinomycetota bacterium]|nr:alpha/beta hydrolase [Actinomycetota bacterium]
MKRALIFATTFVVLVALLAACGNDGSKDAGFEVASQVVSDETTQDILVFEPVAEGSWPVVVAMHGIDGEGQDMAEIGRHLAREGVVVFAPTYRTDMTTEASIEEAATDLECAYRFVRSIAADHGGDLDRPVTFFGWSLGATAALGLGMLDDIDPSGDLKCFSPVPRPDVIVAASGCYYEWQGKPSDLIDVASLGNEDANVVLVGGEDDTNCAASQTEDLAAELRASGYDPEVVMLEGANHYAPVFHDLVDGNWTVVPDEPAGQQTVEVVLDAIAASG